MSYPLLATLARKRSLLGVGVCLLLALAGCGHKAELVLPEAQTDSAEADKPAED